MKQGRGRSSNKSFAKEPRPKIYDRWGRDVSKRVVVNGVVVVGTVLKGEPPQIQAAAWDLSTALEIAKQYWEITLTQAPEEIKYLTTTKEIVLALEKGETFAAPATNKLIRESTFRTAGSVDFREMDGLLYFPAELNLKGQKGRVVLEPQP